MCVDFFSKLNLLTPYSLRLQGDKEWGGGEIKDIDFKTDIKTKSNQILQEPQNTIVVHFSTKNSILKIVNKVVKTLCFLVLSWTILLKLQLYVYE